MSLYFKPFDEIPKNSQLERNYFLIIFNTFSRQLIQLLLKSAYLQHVILTDRFRSDSNILNTKNEYVIFFKHGMGITKRPNSLPDNVRTLIMKDNE